jgi:putative nucleotidyltransferase with HDIG domain
VSLDPIIFGLPAAGLTGALIATGWYRARPNPSGFADIGTVFRDSQPAPEPPATQGSERRHSTEAVFRTLGIDLGEQATPANRTKVGVPSASAIPCPSSAYPICNGCPRLNNDDQAVKSDPARQRNATIRRLMSECLPRNGASSRLLKHSIATGVIAEHLSGVYGVDKTDAATGGLLHDLGRFGMSVGFGRRYSRLANRTFDGITDVLAAEVAEFEMDHCRIGELICRAWALPDTLREVISTHHEQPAGPNLAGLIRLSCRLADAFLFEAVSYWDTWGPVATADELAEPEKAGELARLRPEIESDIIQRLQCPGY